MDATALADSLRQTRENAPHRDMTLHMHLWAIQHAEELGEYPGKVDEVARLLGVKCAPAINDGRKLAGYVCLCS